MPSRPTRIICPRTLRAVWDRSRDATSRPGKPGIDGITAKLFNAKLDRHISAIHAEIKNGSFRFQSLRPVFIPKDVPNKFRTICIPTVKDRLVQRVIADHLEKGRRLPIFNLSSYAYIKDRGLNGALGAALALRQDKPWVLKTDIQAFFDNIPRDFVKQKLRRALGRSSLIPLLDQIVDTEAHVRKCDQFRYGLSGLRNGRGIRQGMPLSPVLANLALSDFDNEIERRNFSMVRYSDDLAFFFSSESECLEAYKIIVEELARIELAVPKLDLVSKTQIVAPNQRLHFLGREFSFYLREQRYVMLVGGPRIASIIDSIKSEHSFNNALKRGDNLSRYMQGLDETIGAYLAAYRGVHDYDRLVERLRRCGLEAVNDLFISIFGAENLAEIDNDKLGFLGVSRLRLAPADDIVEF